jgi:signal transduction histidine kinase
MKPAQRPEEPIEDLPGFAPQVHPAIAATPAARLAERREHSLLSLIELSHELRVPLDPYGIGNLALFNLMGHFGTPRAALWLISEEQHRAAVLIRAHGLRDEAARAIGAGLGAQMRHHWTYEQTPLRIADWADTVRVPGADLALESGLSVLAPVPSHGDLIGLIAIGTRVSGEPYAPLDDEYLAAAAGMVGVAIENARLYHRMVEVNRQLRQANQNLSQLDSLKAQFVQNVNHELRTPIAIITGYLENLLASGGLTDPQRRALETVSGQAEKLSFMVQNLLDLSSVSDQAVSLDMREASVIDLVSACAVARRPGVTGGLRELTCEVEPGTPHACFDEKRLTQALHLLIDNAVKFTPLGARIVLRARPLDADTRYAVIEVQDNGPGIKPEDMPAVLQSFRQGDGSATRRVGGMGIGLALVREIVERMGGRLECASTFGEGTTFSIVLKAAH